MTRSQFSGPTQRAITVAAQRSLAAEAPVRLSPHHSPAGSCKRRLTDAELLSGAFYLADLRRPQAPALALPWQAGGGRRGDPIAPLPGIWCRPIRRSVLSIPGSQGSSATIRKARLLHIPSTRLQKPSTAPAAPHAQRSGSNRVEKPTTVPPAIQADGSVDIPGRNDQPIGFGEVRHRSRKRHTANASRVNAARLQREPEHEPLQEASSALLTLDRPGGPSPIAWALLSQIIWLPLLGIDLHDRWQARVRVEQEIAAASARLRAPAAVVAGAGSSDASRETARTASVPTARLLLGTTVDGLESASQSLRSASQGLSARLSGQPISAARSRQREMLLAPQTSRLSVAPLRFEPLRFEPLQPPAGLLTARFTNAELLGGPLSLADLRRPSAPALALAERARWARSDDPLAPLPGVWREPIRRAILSLPGPQGAPATIREARVLHVPSSRVQKPTTVPLAIQADGSVDILGSGDQPGVVEEVRHWSRNQASRNASGVSATLLHLEPLPTVGPAVLSPERPASSARPSPTRPRDTAVSAASSRPAPARETPASAVPPSPVPAWQPSLSTTPTPPAPAAAIPPQPPERALLSPAALQEPAAATPASAPAP